MTGRFPRQFGKYVLLKPLAKGGMGEIYLAAGGEVGGFEKLCVIKKVIAEKADRTKANRFMDEAKVVLRLSHSALVSTFDCGEVNGEFYIAMELIEGKDLREVWNRCVRTRQRIPLDVALFVVREVARALAYVHEYGDLKLVHRDVAPPNILLAYVGDVKLTDFGLARSVLKQEHTAPGVVFGRAAYLAPEQARGEVADARTDVYTLGIVLWELLTGQQFLQLSGLDPAAALAIVRHPKVVPPSTRAPWITPALDQVAMRALAPDRTRRFQSAEELRQGLSSVIAELAPTADSSRVSDFLRSIYAQTIAEEQAEREAFLKEEIPRFRSSLPRGGRPSPPSMDIVRDEPPVGAGPAPAEGKDPGAAAPQAAPPAEEQKASESPAPRRAPLPGMPAPGPRRGDEPRERAEPTTPEVTPPGAAKTPGGSNGSNGAPLARRSDARATLGRFRLVRPILETAAGVVYAAEHTQTGAPAVVRTFVGAGLEAALEPWKREVLAAAALRHPRVPQVIEAGMGDDGRLFVGMEPLAGGDLATLLGHEQRLDPALSVRIALALSEALGAAHARGLLHGTLRPACVFFAGPAPTAEGVRLLDFGLGALYGAEVRKRGTLTGMPTGLIEYLAPEQLRGAPADARTDVYALGAILYEMVTGLPPFAGTAEAIERKKQSPPQSPRMFRPELGPELEQLILTLLDPDPARRPASAAELPGRLEAVAPAGADEDERRAEQERLRARREAAFRAIADLAAEAAAAVVLPLPALAGGGDSPRVASPPPPAVAAPSVSVPTVPPALGPAPVLGGGVLARYGVGPEAEGRARQKRVIRLVVLIVAGLAAAIGIVKLVPGSRAEKSPASAPR